MPELVFSVAAGSGHAYEMLAEALQGEVGRQDAVVSPVTGELPALRPDRVFVAVGAVEELAQAPEARRDRTILISPSPPGTARFDAEMAMAPKVALTLHPNFAVARKMQDEGLPAGHLQLGYEPAWDAFDPAAGTELEIIRSESEMPCFDWLRALLAIHRGAVVLHERCLGSPPLIAGRHIFVASRESIPAMAEALRADQERCQRVAQEAHLFISRLLRMEIGAAALIGHARVLVVQPVG